MAIEQAVYDAFRSAIINHPAYSTVWNKVIFYVDDFEKDIPSGNKHKGHCPFVAFRGGASDSFSQVAGDLFSGEMEFEILIAMATPLTTSSYSSWSPIQIFTGEIERAIDSIDSAGFKMKPDTSKGYPPSIKGMITRLLTVTCELSECRAFQYQSSFDTNPTISGIQEVGEIITAVDGTATGNPEPAIIGEWYLDAVPTGNIGLTYLINYADIGKELAYVNTASTVEFPDVTAISNTFIVLPTSNGALDAVPYKPATFAVGDQLLLKDFTGDNAIINSNTLNATIGFEDGAFSETDYNAATASGTYPAYVVERIDQTDNDNPAEQSVESKRPLISSTGEETYDGVDDYLVSNYALGNGDNFSIWLVGFDSGSDQNDAVCSQSEGAGSSWRVQVGFVPNRWLEFHPYESNVSNPWRWDCPSFFDGTKPKLHFTYESGVGAKLYADGIEQILVRIGGTGTVDLTGARLQTSGYALGSKSFLGNRSVTAMHEHTLNRDDVLAINSTYDKREIDKWDYETMNFQKIKSFFDAMGTERVSFVAMGDSNQIRSGYGNDGGFQDALAKHMPCFGTGIMPATFDPVDYGGTIGYKTEINQEGTVDENTVWQKDGNNAYQSLRNIGQNSTMPMSGMFGLTGELTNETGMTLESNNNYIAETDALDYKIWASTYAAGSGQLSPSISNNGILIDTINIEPITGVDSIVEHKISVPQNNDRLGREMEFKFADDGTRDKWGVHYQQLLKADQLTGWSYTTIFGFGGLGLLKFATELRDASDESLELYMQAVRSETGGKACFIIDSGINDRVVFDDSIGPNPTDSSTQLGYLDNFQYIVGRLEEVWVSSGGVLDDLFFLSAQDHPMYEPDAVHFVLYSEIIARYSMQRERVAVVYQRNIRDSDYYTANDWYGHPVDDLAHLSVDGYNGKWAAWMDLIYA